MGLDQEKLVLLSVLLRLLALLLDQLQLAPVVVDKLACWLALYGLVAADLGMVCGLAELRL